MEIHIRLATDADARDAIHTLRRSIAELCGADHGNDPSKIDDWLRNKTEAAWRGWLARPDAVVLVAERQHQIAGVGMAAMNGEVLLNYVHPDQRFLGISKAVLVRLEQMLEASGVRQCRLDSTVTARAFYIQCGYRPDPDKDRSLSKPL